MFSFSKLENNNLSKIDIDIIAECSIRGNFITDSVSNKIVDIEEFENYLQDKMKNNLSALKFENIIRNVFYNYFPILQSSFIHVISTNYLKNNYLEYFHNLIIFEKRRSFISEIYNTEANIMLMVIDSIIFHISHNYYTEEALQQLVKLSKDTNISYHYLLCKLSKIYESRGDRVRILLMVDLLSEQDKYDLLGTTIEMGNAYLFADIENSLILDNFDQFVSQKLTDEENLCKVIRSYDAIKPNLLWLNRSSFLRKILLSIPEKIPLTLEHILQLAIKESMFDIVIELGECFPKKRILEIISSKNDKLLLDKFFSKYKKYPEIKKWAPFI